MPLELRKALKAIENSLADAEIGKAVELAGYPQAALLEGKRLCDLAIAEANRSVNVAEALHNANDEVLVAKKTAHEAFMAFCLMAKDLFGRNVLSSLGLNDLKPRVNAAFLAKAYEVFDNAARLPGIQEKLTGAGFDQARLQADRMKIATLDMALQTLQAAKDARKQAIEDRGKALLDVKEWLEPYIKAASTVLHEKKELLKKLGIKFRSESMAAQPTVANQTEFVPVKPSIPAFAAVNPRTSTDSTATKLGQIMSLL
jgi:hypothetical protein